MIDPAGPNQRQEASEQHALSVVAPPRLASSSSPSTSHPSFTFPPSHHGSPSVNLPPLDTAALPLPSPSFAQEGARKGHAYHGSVSTSGSSSAGGFLSGLDSPRVLGIIDSPPSSTMGSPPIDYGSSASGRGWGTGPAGWKADGRHGGSPRVGGGAEEWQSHPRHHCDSAEDRGDDGASDFGGPYSSHESSFQADVRATMTTPEFVSSFDPDAPSSKPWTSAFGVQVGSTSSPTASSSASSPPPFSPSSLSFPSQPLSPTSLAPSSSASGSSSQLVILPDFPRSRHLLEEDGTPYETADMRVAKSFKRWLDEADRDAAEVGTVRRSRFLIESTDRKGVLVHRVMKRSSENLKSTKMTTAALGFGPTSPPGPSSPRKPTLSSPGLWSPSSTSALAFTSVPMASPSASTRAPPLSPSSLPRGKRLRGSQSMQSIKPLAFPEAATLGKFFGGSESFAANRLASGNPSISLTVSTPSPARRRQQSGATQPFPSSLLGEQSVPPSPTRARTPSRPTYPTEQPQSPGRLRRISQQLSSAFRPGQLEPLTLSGKPSSGSLRGFLRKMGSTPALRGQQSFGSDASTETARPDGPTREDSAATAKAVNGRSRARTSAGMSPVKLRAPSSAAPDVLLGPVAQTTPLATMDDTSPSSPTRVASQAVIQEQHFTPHVLDVFFSREGQSTADYGSDPRFVISDSSVKRTRTPSGQAVVGSFSPSGPNSSTSLPEAAHSLPPSFQDGLSMRAATIERWVAELGTSVSPGRWLDLFLVYRAFITPLSLSRLLMVQFEWGCRVAASDGPELKYAKELMVSRTFHGLKMWLTGFFEVDWIAEVQMRNEFTGWLNQLSGQRRQECFTPVARALISNLKKLVKAQRAKYDGTAKAEPAPSIPPPTSTSAASLSPTYSDHRQQITIHQNTSSTRSGSSSSASFSPPPAFVAQLPKVFSKLTFRSVGKGKRFGSRPMLSANSFEPEIHDLLATRQGRQELENALLIAPSPPASDFESSAASNSEDSHGGSGSEVGEGSTGAATGLGLAVTGLDEDSRRSSTQPSFLDSVAEERASQEMERPAAILPEAPMSLIVPETEAAIATEPSDVDLGYDIQTAARARSPSPPPLPPRAAAAPVRQPLFSFSRDDPVQDLGSPMSPAMRDAIVPFHTRDIDDVDFNSDSDESTYQRPERRLPNAAQGLQLVRRSIDTLSSYIQQPQRGSTHSHSSTGSNTDPYNYELLKVFNPEIFEKDEEDSGTPADALARLNGFVDPDKEEEKRKLVDRLVEEAIVKSRMRSSSAGEDDRDVASPDSSNPRSGFNGRESLISLSEPSTGPATGTASLLPAAEVESGRTSPDMDALVDSINAPPARPSNPGRPPTASPAPSIAPNESTPPMESTPRPLSSKKLPSVVSPPPVVRKTPITPKRNSLRKRRPSNPPPVPALRHVCFIVNIKTELVAAGLANVHGQIMNGISFKELGTIPPLWQTHPAPVFDSWEDLIKEKMRRKALGQPKISDVAMWLSRFEIMVRWVQSEIILTLRNSNQSRHTPSALFSRFVKLAYKSYELSDFLSTVAIVEGLHTPAVRLSLGEKTWLKLSRMHEMPFLQNVCSSAGGYPNIRRLHQAVEDSNTEWFSSQWTDASKTHPNVPASGAERTSAEKERKRAGGHFYVPLLTIYLQDLEQIERAPDPALPSTAGLDPLPAGITPGPLINVEKATKRAAILRNAIIMNTLASNYPTEIDGNVYRHCLKLGALSHTFLKGLTKELRNVAQ